MQNIDIIQEALSDFQIVHKDQTNNYLSLAICANLNHGVSVSDNEYFPQVNGIYAEIVKCQTRVKVLLLYRAKDIHPLQFCNNLENIIFSHEIDLILGDFNMNFFNETDSYQLRQVMLRAHYTQVVKDSAFVSAGSLLDHVYIRERSLGNFKDVKCEVKSVYYSDHDCVQICLSDNVGKGTL